MRETSRATALWLTTITFAVAGIAASGCSREPAATPAAGAPPASTPAPAPAPAPATAPASAPAAAPAAAPAPGPAPTAAPGVVLARQEFNTDPDLSCEILEVRRVSGSALLVKWRLLRPPAAGDGLATGRDKTVYHTWSWNDVYFTDAAENKKYSGLKDTAGAWLSQGDTKAYKAGDRQNMWMKFPAPPDSSTKVTFVFPGFPPFEDLPVAP